MSLHPQIDLFISTSNFGLSSSRPKDQSLIRHGVLAFSSCESEVVTSCSHPGNSPEPLRFRLPDIACTTPPSARALPAEHPSKYAASRYYPVARTRTPFRGHVPDVITTPLPVASPQTFTSLKPSPTPRRLDSDTKPNPPTPPAITFFTCDVH